MGYGDSVSMIKGLLSSKASPSESPSCANCASGPRCREPSFSYQYEHPSLHRKKADDYLSHLIGHEGRGSLLSALKSRGWASELSGGVTEQSTAFYLFDIVISLTEAGLAHGSGTWRMETGSGCPL